MSAGHGGHGGGGDEIIGHAKAKRTVTARFTLLETGDFQIFCSLPGHKEGGMVGVPTVICEPPNRTTALTRPTDRSHPVPRYGVSAHDPA